MLSNKHRRQHRRQHADGRHVDAYEAAIAAEAWRNPPRVARLGLMAKLTSA